MNIKDLSVRLDHTTTVYPGDPEVHLEVATTIKEHGYALQRLQLGSQSGTHVDSPAHFAPLRDEQSKSLDDVPLEQYVGPAVVFDLRGITGKILPEHLKNPERLQKGSVALLLTDWHKHQGEAFFQHPYLGTEAANLLIQAGVKMVGTDCINIGKTVLQEGWDFPINRLLLHHGVVILENLRNLAEVTEGDLIVALPLKLGSSHQPSDGSPVRAVAISF